MAQLTIIHNSRNIGIMERISTRQWYWLSAINGDRGYAASKSAALSSLKLRAPAAHSEQAVDHSAARMVEAATDKDGFLRRAH